MATLTKAPITTKSKINKVDLPDTAKKKAHQPGEVIAVGPLFLSTPHMN